MAWRGQNVPVGKPPLWVVNHIPERHAALDLLPPCWGPSLSLPTCWCPWHLSRPGLVHLTSAGKPLCRIQTCFLSQYSVSRPYSVAGYQTVFVAVPQAVRSPSRARTMSGRVLFCAPAPSTQADVLQFNLQHYVGAEQCFHGGMTRTQKGWRLLEESYALQYRER